MRDGSLEVEFAREEEAARALRADLFIFSQKDANGRRDISLPITVEPHRTKNSVKGVINCFDLRGVSDDEIVDGLAEFGVTEARRMMVKKQKQPSPYQQHSPYVQRNEPTERRTRRLHESKCP